MKSGETDEKVEVVNGAEAWCQKLLQRSTIYAKYGCSLLTLYTELISIE